jgi:hypothetical protein
MDNVCPTGFGPFHILVAPVQPNCCPSDQQALQNGTQGNVRKEVEENKDKSNELNG